MALPTPQALYAVLKGQFGYVEKGGRDGKSGNLTKFGAAYGMNGVAYCSIGVWWCFKQIGIDVRQMIAAGYASAEQAMEGWQHKGWFIRKTPKFMDVVFFHFEGEHAGANHTGFAIAADAGGVHTGEFNTSAPGATGSQVNGGGCYQRYRPYSQILGYGRYPWPQGVTPPALPKVKPSGMSGAKTYPTLGLDDHGHPLPNMKVNDIKRLQYLLHIPVTGVFDAMAQLHTKQAQFNRHLVQDGIAGPATLRALGF